MDEELRNQVRTFLPKSRMTKLLDRDEKINNMTGEEETYHDLVKFLITCQKMSDIQVKQEKRAQ